MNQSFNKILVVQDAYRDSIKAVEWAARMVPSTGRVKIFDVQPPLTSFWLKLFTNEYDQTPSFHRKKSLAELTRTVDFPTKHVSGQVSRGTPALEIVREAISGGHDLVIKEAYAKASDIVFGNLDMRLLRYCSTPLWLSHPNSKRSTCSRVLVALNPDADEKEMRLNERLLQYASAVSLGFNCKLYVVGAYQSHVTAFPSLDRDFLKRFEQHSKNAKQQAKENLARLVRGSQKSIDSKNIILQDGKPDEVILDAVDQVTPDLLVMGSVARHGISGLLVGNAAERVIRQVGCSVLTIKPKGFVSPIAREKSANEGSGVQLAF